MLIVHARLSVVQRQSSNPDPRVRQMLGVLHYSDH